jgi:hypothetical protein
MGKWENYSAFCLEFRAAVVPQGMFKGKKIKISWLYGPIATLWRSS